MLTRKYCPRIDIPFYSKYISRLIGRTLPVFAPSAAYRPASRKSRPSAAQSRKRKDPTQQLKLRKLSLHLNKHRMGFLSALSTFYSNYPVGLIRKHGCDIALLNSAIFHRSDELPAHLKYKDLAEKVPTTLTLPYKYRLLEDMFRGADTVISIMHNRLERCTFDKLKRAVQDMIRRYDPIATDQSQQRKSPAGILTQL